MAQTTFQNGSPNPDPQGNGCSGNDITHAQEQQTLPDRFPQNLVEWLARTPLGASDRECRCQLTLPDAHPCKSSGCKSCAKNKKATVGPIFVKLYIHNNCFSGEDWEPPSKQNKKSWQYQLF